MATNQFFISKGNPVLGGAIAGGLGLFSNAISNFIGQSNFDEALEWQKWQYHDMARRQDPVHQVQRLRAAGINPALAYGNVSLGQATGSSAPPSFTPNSLDLSGLSALANSLDLNGAQKRNIDSDTEKKEVETEGERTDNLFRAENWKSLIYGRDSHAWLQNQLSDAAKLDVQYQKQSMQFRVEQQRYQLALLQGQTVAQDLVNFYLPSKLPAEVNNLISQQFANYATGKASLRNAHANLMEIYSKYGGTKEERNDYFKASLNYLVQQKSESQSRERANDRVIDRVGIGPLQYNNVYTYNKNSGEYDRR